MELVAAEVGAVTTCSLGLLVASLKRRIFAFVNLRENRDSLTNKADELERRASDIKERIRMLRFESLFEYRESAQVLLWFIRLDKFREEFDQLPGRRNSIMIRSNCKLGMKVAKLQKEADKLLSSEICDALLAFMDANSKYLYYRTRLVDDLWRDGCAGLRAVKEDVEKRVEELLSKQLHKKPSSRVSFWLESADRFSKNVAAVRDLFEKTDYKSDSECKACMEEVDRLQEKSRKLSEEGKDLLLAEDRLLIRMRSTIAEIVPTFSPVIGHEDELSRALHLIDEDGVNVIGICGMGGIGKTTLLKNINNHYCHKDNDANSSGDFDIVVYVNVGRERSAEKIREQICSKLCIFTSYYEPEMGLLNYLKNKNFLLMMDDVWNGLTLEEIGIPVSNFGTSDNVVVAASASAAAEARKAKVVVTTRSKKVCKDMKITERMTVEMGLLNKDESWELFSLHVGNQLDLPQEARDVKDKCGGLPLALVAVASAMMGKIEARAWKDAKVQLEQAACASTGMDKVFSALKFSFDRLKDDGLRETLLYCSLYPQGCDILLKDVIDLLIGEGLTDAPAKYHTRELAKIRARGMISHLVDAGLLMQQNAVEESVKLHDCVRDMAVWLTDGTNYKSDLFLRWSPADQESLSRFLGRWDSAKRVAMFYSNHDHLCVTCMPKCEKLQTFIWEMGHWVPQDEFFASMPNVRVLDMSSCLMKEIHPSIGYLVHLRYLNFQSTEIQELPRQLGELHQLVQLILRYTCALTNIPRESISRLDNLEKLDMLGSGYPWTVYEDSYSHANKKLALIDLDDLAKKGNLSDVAISIECDGQLLPSLANSKHLLDSITHMDLSYREESNRRGPVVDLEPAIGEVLHSLLTDPQCQEKWPGVTDVRKELDSLLPDSQCQEKWCGVTDVGKVWNSCCRFQVLSNLRLKNCSGVTEFTWTARLPCLKIFEAEGCQDLRTLLSSVSRHEMPPSSSSSSSSRIGAPFSSLRELLLIDCKSLSVISEGTILLLPSLEYLYVRSCENMEELSFSYESAPLLKSIRGSSEWWKRLIWSSTRLEDKFRPHFSPI